ncbi:hypothetical protein LCGC14_1071010 [marine sediment metagenome]|uniref:DNA methylase N-4/N-6 domain-containing protein n=1 Tax=marine sediment metagenome TaxID=412755 RepID=A0A0F9MN39_9ZZZZ
MKIEKEDLEKNTSENSKIGSLRNFKEKESDLNKIDNRNRINELSLKEWIRHTNSLHRFNKKVPRDALKSAHPATFEEELPFYYIEFFSKTNDIILDPFMGTGTTSIASNLLDRRSIGIEINKRFTEIAKRRFEINGLKSNRHFIFEGDCYKILQNGELSSLLEDLDSKIAFTITSPPFHNILKFNSNKKGRGISYYKNYGDQTENLENIEDYHHFLKVLKEIFDKIYRISKNKGYLVINVKNFYRKVKYKNGRISQEIQFFAWDLASYISKTKWIPCGEQIWDYQNKSLFPFGYPYVYLANITHSYNLIFYKDISKK